MSIFIGRFLILWRIPRRRRDCSCYGKQGLNSQPAYDLIKKIIPILQPKLYRFAFEKLNILCGELLQWNKLNFVQHLTNNIKVKKIFYYCGDVRAVTFSLPLNLGTNAPSTTRKQRERVNTNVFNKPGDPAWVVWITRRHSQLLVYGRYEYLI